MKDEFRDSQLPMWEKMIKNLFSDKVPISKEWADQQSIIDVLNYVGNDPALNHTFLPDGGGLDLHGCTISNEKNCIELNLGGMAHILKPKKLTFQWFEDTDYEWGYFLLELENLNPTGVYETLFREEEELVEIYPGEYIDRGYWDAGEYYGEPLPKGARLVGRYLSGSLVTFSKASLYNANSSTYDGRHNKMTPDVFKQHIQDVVNYLKEN